jgi:hypothetical protein
MFGKKGKKGAFMGNELSFFKDTIKHDLHLQKK